MDTQIIALKELFIEFLNSWENLKDISLINCEELDHRLILYSLKYPILNDAYTTKPEQYFTIHYGEHQFFMALFYYLKNASIYQESYEEYLKNNKIEQNDEKSQIKQRRDNAIKKYRELIAYLLKQSKINHLSLFSLDNMDVWNIMTTCYLGVFKKNQSRQFLKAIMDFFEQLFRHFNKIRQHKFEEYHLTSVEQSKLMQVLLNSQSVRRYLDEKMYNNFQNISQQEFVDQLIHQLTIKILPSIFQNIENIHGLTDFKGTIYIQFQYFTDYDFVFVHRFVVLIHELGHKMRIMLTSLDRQQQKPMDYSPESIGEAGLFFQKTVCPNHIENYRNIVNIKKEEKLQQIWDLIGIKKDENTLNDEMEVFLNEVKSGSFLYLQDPVLVQQENCDCKIF